MGGSQPGPGNHTHDQFYCYMPCLGICTFVGD